MIRKLHVKNFKSIADLTLEPGAVNVLIGENGCGKTNFLEALAFASAADANKLDNEFLASRGLRVTAPEFMFSAFAATPEARIQIAIRYNDGWESRITVVSEAVEPYPRWHPEYSREPPKDWIKTLDLQRDPPTEVLESISDKTTDDFLASLAASASADLSEELGNVREAPSEARRIGKKMLANIITYIQRETPHHSFSSFLVYSPENSALRTFAKEGQILPLGIKGEGLFKLLRVLSEDTERWREIQDNLRLLDWFDELKIAPEQAPFEQSLQIRDRFIAKPLRYFDQRSANEGFLFLLFYFALIISADTPPIFAIDNVDTSLNPKIATALMNRLTTLAKKYQKQIFLTTHSPAVLDGIDLNDDEQRLFVVHRNRQGETRARRVTAPKPVAGETPIKLSDAFLRGLLGGLPQNF